MTRDVRNNLIIAALAVSVVAHFGAMFWARPRVMTHVVTGIARAARRGPMRVTEAQAKPEPVAIAVLKDETAAKDAPRTEETVAILPAEDVSLPSAPAQAVVPATAMPDVLSGLSPDVAAPKVEVASVAESAPAKPVETMKFETPQMANAAGMSVGLSMPTDLVAAPVFEAPVFAPVGSFRETEAEPEIVRVKTEETRPKEVFKPVEEVMPKVDEQVVQAEKEAVRNLMESTSALDMRSVVDVSLATSFEGGHTYFKATIRSKPRVPSVPKDVVVLIDASGSIGHDRLSSCRKAAKEILRTAMNTGDRFNLVAFRDRFAYAFKTWQPCDAASYAAGDRWMTRLAAHGRTDVFSTISSVLTLPRDPTRPLVALVVTDGDANTGVSATAEILAKFTKLNDGLISVYMYGVKSSANRELIDVLTHGNRGESFIFDGWRWNAGEGIGAFSERFRDPIVTDLRLAFPAACAAEAYPALLKNLYRDNAVDLIGRVAGRPGEIVFTLRGIAGSLAYDGFFRLPVRTARTDARLPAAWRAERQLDAKLR